MIEIKTVPCHTDLRKVSASDEDVIEAMLVSTQGQEVLELWEREGIDSMKGRINFLMKNRHGSPFEHNYFKFFVKAPIAVFREHHRHRIGWSYNEESGRYKELQPEFYLPSHVRPLVQKGKPGAYHMVPGTDEQYGLLVTVMMENFQRSYDDYQVMLGAGIAREVARGVLPVYIMTSMFATCNARSMMNFLSLRVDAPEATFPSKPMWEIDYLVARHYEYALATHMPLTYEAFLENGRVAP